MRLEVVAQLRAVVGRLDLKTVAAEYMEHLCQLTGETVHLSVLDGTEVIYLDKVDSPHPVRAYSQVGGRAWPPGRPCWPTRRPC